MKTRVVTPPSGVYEAAQILADGGLVALPTETVYGLGADALNPLACARIFEAKERPLFDPLIVHVPEREWLEKLAKPNGLARRLAEAYWPGPLTMVLPKQDIVPELVTSGQDTVALRMSGHAVFQQVALAFGRPIAAPSANRFGRISPTTAAHVVSELEGRIPLVLDGGTCTHGIESTIVLVHEQGVEILRHGPVTGEMLGELGPVLPPGDNVTTPGAMKSHYAPGTPLVLTETREKLDLPPGAKVGLLAWGASRSEERFERVERLSANLDLKEAAANLYGAMRRLDEAGLDLIVADEVPRIGLGVAIMERLGKAAARE